MKILIVDDSKNILRAFAKLYQKLAPDAEIITALTAEEAEPYLTEHYFDFASLDLNLPGKDGLELAAIIKLKSPVTRMVLITANVQDAVKVRAEAIGVQVIEKPMSPKEKEEFVIRLQGFLEVD